VRRKHVTPFAVPVSLCDFGNPWSQERFFPARKLNPSLRHIIAAPDRIFFLRIQKLAQ
jgi:hypothetical protein